MAMMDVLEDQVSNNTYSSIVVQTLSRGDNGQYSLNLKLEGKGG